jgi:hypothetical protein
MSPTLSNGVSNGRPRKQLSDELDRLDGILDGLADGLQDAITDAVRAGSRLAIKDAIIEVLSNPELKAAIQGPSATSTVPPASASNPSLSNRSPWDRVKAILRRTRTAVAAAARRTRTIVTTKVRTAATVVAGAGKMTVSAWRMKRAVLVTAGVGVGLGAGAYYSAPHAGAVLSAAAGAVVAITVKTALCVRSALRAILQA